MKYDQNLKVDKETGIEIITQQISILKNLQDINSIKQIFKNLIEKINTILNSTEITDKLKSKLIYQENEYSQEKTRENILKAKERVINYLEDIVDYIKNNCNELVPYNEEFSVGVGILIVKKILNNFYMHIETMYEHDVHGRAGITKKDLDKIKIVNEYDVQRILYSLIKPIFPDARLEVSNDTGFSTIRYDILIEKLSLIIEVKCSRQNMTEKSLTEEIAADIVHYKYDNIFFFIYDKEKIIKNSTSFINAYSGKFDNKVINTIIIQPRIL